jgi:hypothetical protein
MMRSGIEVSVDLDQATDVRGGGLLPPSSHRFLVGLKEPTQQRLPLRSNVSFHES